MTSASTSEPDDLEAAERASPPAPKLLYEVANPVMKALLRSPLHGIVSDSLILLTFTGRKTGRTYTTPVGYQQHGDRLTVFTHGDWWKNLRGGRSVTVLLRGERRAGVARPVTDLDGVLDRVETFLAENGVENLRRIGVTVDDPDPSDEALRDAVSGTTVIDIDLSVDGAGDE